MVSRERDAGQEDEEIREQLSSVLGGKTVVITGSSRGIGRETARLFATQGCNVVVNGRTGKPLDETRHELEDAGLSVLAVRADVRRAEECRHLIEEAAAVFGGIDILINNAGVTARGNFEQLSPGVVETVVGTNVLGCLYPTLFALPHLRSVKGSVVFVSSIAGLRGLPGSSVYSTSKMALSAFSQALRAEVDADGIHVGVLHVGFTEYGPDKRVLSPDGTPQPISRPSHVTQRQVARTLLSMVLHRRSRHVMTPVGKIMSVASRFVPSLLDYSLPKVTRRFGQYYS